MDFGKCFPVVGVSVNNDLFYLLTDWGIQSLAMKMTSESYYWNFNMYLVVCIPD